MQVPPAEHVARMREDLHALAQVVALLCPEGSGHTPFSASASPYGARVHLPFGAFMDAHMSGLVGNVTTNESSGVGDKRHIHYTGTMTSRLPSGTCVVVVACEQLPDAPAPDAPVSPNHR